MDWACWDEGHIVPVLTDSLVGIRRETAALLQETWGHAVEKIHPRVGIKISWQDHLTTKYPKAEHFLSEKIDFFTFVEVQKF